MSELERLLSQLPPLPEGMDPPAWLADLLAYLQTQEAEINRLKQALAKLEPGQPPKPAPLPALDLDALESAPRHSLAEEAPLKFMELNLSEAELQAAAQQDAAPVAPAPGEEHIFEDPEEAPPEEDAPPLDQRYIVAVDRDLQELIPQFMKDRQRESDDYSLWLRMDDFERVKAACRASRGVMMTFGFDYLSKVALLIAQKAEEKNRKAAEKALFEYNFFLDQCRIEYQ